MYHGSYNQPMWQGAASPLVQAFAPHARRFGLRAQHSSIRPTFQPTPEANYVGSPLPPRAQSDSTLATRIQGSRSLFQCWRKLRSQRFHLACVVQTTLLCRCYTRQTRGAQVEILKSQRLVNLAV
jgi:hypothetical protein